MPITIKATQEEATTADPRASLPLAPNKPWTYAHSPLGWMFSPDREDGKGSWLPYLNEHQHVRGANGVDSAGNPAAMLGSLQQQGKTVILPTDARLGPYRNYVHSFPCAMGNVAGKYYATKFETPVVRGRKVRWKVDTEGYRDFLQYLVDNNIVSPMGDDILEEKLDTIDDRISRHERSAHNPVFKEKAEEARKLRQKMVDAWERQFGKPKRTKK